MSGVPPPQLDRLREMVTRGDPLAIEALGRWQRWQDTPRESERLRRHRRRAFERLARQALNDDRPAGRPS